MDAAQDFLQSLRTETDSLHRQLEDTSISRQLMSPAISRKDYCLYLSLMRNVIAWQEATVFPLVKNILETDSRQKLPGIDRDLSQLSAAPHSIPFTFPQEMRDTPSALGAMYVLEGSTLGGRVILKHLAQTLQLDETNGAAFFYGYGPETGKQWSSYLKVLTGYAVTEHCEERIISSAKNTFEAIHTYFNYIQE